MVGKRLVNTGGAVAAFDPLQNFEIVTYTGNGGTQKITGYIRKGAAFPTSTSKINLPETYGAEGEQFTYSLWFNTSTADGSYMFAKRFGENTFHIRIDNSFSPAGKICINNWAGTAQSANNAQSTSGGYNDGNWHHFVFTYDGTRTPKTQCYIDGQRDTGMNYDYDFGTQSVANGNNIGNYDLNNKNFSGKLDQIRIFDKAISSSEVTTLYNETYASSTKSTTDIFGDSSGVALYEFDVDASDTGPDGGFSIDGFVKSTGNNDYFDTNVDQLQTQTISFWAKIPTSTGSNRSLLDTRNSSGEAGILLRTTSNNNELEFSDYATSSNNSTGTWSSTESDVYKHFLIILESTQARVYENNVLKATVSAASTNIQNGGDIYFGDNPLNSVNVSDAYIEYKQIRTYARALSDSDRTSLYNEDFTNLNVISTPESWFNFDNNSSGSVNDKTGSYTGNISGMTYTAPSNYDGTPTDVNFLGMAFQPDFVWIKNRDSAYDHYLYDSIRGANEKISSNTTDLEATQTNGLSSFDTNGFTLAGNRLNVNENNSNHVSWCWKAGGTAVSNTDGDVTSSVSANQDAGFSIVKVTDKTNTVESIGHGLSSAPEFIITKLTETTQIWLCYHKDTGTNGYLSLNGTGAFTSLSGMFSAVDSTTFTTNTAAATSDMIAYCFHSVDGYQKVGSYSGGTLNKIVYTTDDGTVSGTGGFKPRFIILKNTTTAGYGWAMFDSLRGVDGSNDAYLAANDSAAESDVGGRIEFVSNGFQLTTTNANYNGSGDTYIYLAIA